MHKTKTSVIRAGAALGIAAVTLLAACGSSDSTATKTTTTKASKTASTTAAKAPASRAAFCSDIKAAFGDYQPGFDAIFANGNDNPTLAEWAAFLPKPTAEFDAAVARVEAVKVPSDDPEIAAAFSRATAAFDAMSQSYHDGAKAAAAGDEAEFKRLESQNQGENASAMQKAMGDVQSLCAKAQD